MDETADLHPITAYAISKVRVEQDVAGLADDGFSPRFLRKPTAYGVSPRLRFDLVLNNLVAWAYGKDRVHIKSGGTPWRPIVHIEDMARLVLEDCEGPRFTRIDHLKQLLASGCVDGTLRWKAV